MHVILHAWMYIRTFVCTMQVRNDNFAKYVISVLMQLCTYVHTYVCVHMLKTYCTFTFTYYSF